MAYFNLLAKCDKALVAYLIRLGAGAVDDVFPAKRSQTKEEPPLTICNSHTGTPLPDAPYSGTMTVEAYVEVRTSGVQEVGEGATDARDASDERVSATFDAFQMSVDFAGDKLGDAITTAGRSAGVSDLTILDVKITDITQGFNPRNPNQQGDCWVDCIHLEMVAGPFTEPAE